MIIPDACASPLAHAPSCRSPVTRTHASLLLPVLCFAMLNYINCCAQHHEWHARQASPTLLLTGMTRDANANPCPEGLPAPHSELHVQQLPNKATNGLNPAGAARCYSGISYRPCMHAHPIDAGAASTDCLIFTGSQQQHHRHPAFGEYSLAPTAWLMYS